jgi:hypothetical protein
MTRWVVVAVLVAAGAGCGKAPSDEQCTQLLEHLVDLEFKTAGATATADAQKTELAKQKEKVIEAKTTEFMDQCTKKTARDRVECALAATDLEAVAKCDTDGQ